MRQIDWNHRGRIYHNAKTNINVLHQYDRYVIRHMERELLEVRISRFRTAGGTDGARKVVTAILDTLEK